MAKSDWSPPIVREDGVNMLGGYPVNHNLRAEALARRGAKHDPDGLISDGLIEAARRDLPPAPKAKSAKATEGAPAKRGRPARSASPAPVPPQAHPGEPAVASPSSGVTNNG